MEKELDALSAETLALQTLFVGLCKSLSNAGMNGAIVEAFDYAENVATSAAVKLGTNARAGHTLKAVEIIETLRSAVIPDHRKA
jgi:PPE-repeat protein